MKVKFFNGQTIEFSDVFPADAQIDETIKFDDMSVLKTNCEYWGIDKKSNISCGYLYKYEDGVVEIDNSEYPVIAWIKKPDFEQE